MRIALITGHCSAIGKAIEQKLSPEFRFIEWSRCSGVDLSDCMTLPKLAERIDLVVHIAEVGPVGLGNLIDALIKSQNTEASFVLISSIWHLYGNDAYAQSKREQEQRVRDYALKMRTCANVLRLGHIAGTRAWPNPTDKGLSQIPLGKFGTVDMVADAVAFMARSGWMCGSVVTLDGGISLQSSLP